MENGKSRNCSSESESGKIVIATIDDFPKDKTPPCIECGSTLTKSKGEEWKCTECGRRWRKIMRQCKDCPYRQLSAKPKNEAVNKL
jgi:tRNA(Ile2) C34 agmatinyltransferase TiaS